MQLSYICVLDMCTRVLILQTASTAHYFSELYDSVFCAAENVYLTGVIIFCSKSPSEYSDHRRCAPNIKHDIKKSCCLNIWSFSSLLASGILHQSNDLMSHYYSVHYLMNIIFG